MKIILGETLLARGLAEHESPVKLRVTSKRLVQQAAFLRASEMKTFDRGNHQTCVRFELVRRHASQEVASEYSLLHASQLEGCRGTARFVHEHPSGETTITLHHASISRVDSEVKGLTTRHSYELVGGKLSTEIQA